MSEISIREARRIFIFQVEEENNELTPKLEVQRAEIAQIISHLNKRQESISKVNTS